MSNTPPEKASAWNVVRKTVQSDRRRSPLGCLAVAFAIVSGLGLTVWKTWPGGPQPQLMAVAYDQLVSPGETVRVVADLVPVEEGTVDRELAGIELFLRLGQAAWQPARTDAHGGATLQVPVPPGTEVERLAVRYSGNERKQRGMETFSRVFVWPVESRLLVVDADTALAEGFWNTSPQEAVPLPGAVAALRSLAGKVKIVYLTAEAGRPQRTNALRAWLERGWTARGQRFPDGPVIAPLGTDRQLELFDYRRSLLMQLQKRFAGGLAVVTAQPALADAVRATGADVYLLEPGKPATDTGTWEAIGRGLQPVKKS